MAMNSYMISVISMEYWSGKISCLRVPWFRETPAGSRTSWQKPRSPSADCATEPPWPCGVATMNRSMHGAHGGGKMCTASTGRIPLK